MSQKRKPDTREYKKKVNTVQTSLEKRIQDKDAERVTYQPLADQYVPPVNTGWPHRDKKVGEVFEAQHHPDLGDEVEVKVTDRTHSEKYVLSCVEQGLPFKDLFILAGRRLKSWFK